MRLVSALLVLWLVVSCTETTTLRVATDPRRPPLSFLDPHHQPAGFEIDLIRAIAEVEGWNLQIIATSTDGFLRGPDGILPGLTKGDWDLVVSSVEDSNRLKDRWSLSRPYLNVGPVVVTSDQALPPVFEANGSGLIGVVDGSPGASEVRKTPFPTWRVRTYDNPTSALEDLGQGSLTAVVTGSVDVATALYDNEGLQTRLHFGAPLTKDRQLVIVTRRDDGLLTAVNHALTVLEDTGVAESLRKKWGLVP